MQSEVPTEETPISPSVGDKRPREEDGAGEAQAASNDINDQIEQKIATVSDSNANATSHMNGNFGARNGNVSMGGGANDALYVGDLQWVCSLPVQRGDSICTLYSHPGFLFFCRTTAVCFFRRIVDHG